MPDTEGVFVGQATEVACTFLHVAINLIVYSFHKTRLTREGFIYIKYLWYYF
jgi:hypothetical protein